jgi:hypothetical protein
MPSIETLKAMLAALYEKLENTVSKQIRWSIQDEIRMLKIDLKEAYSRLNRRRRRKYA